MAPSGRHMPRKVKYPSRTATVSEKSVAFPSTRLGVEIQSQPVGPLDDSQRRARPQTVDPDTQTGDVRNNAGNLALPGLAEEPVVAICNAVGIDPGQLMAAISQRIPVDA